MKRKASVRLLDLMLLAGGIIVALVVVESGLRIADFSYVSFHRPDDTLGLRLQENAEGWFKSEGVAYIRINSAGFRDRERSTEKPKGVYRIAVLGDSYIEALQVDLAKTFPALLEQRLTSCKAFGRKSIEVLNFGVSGYGTAQQLLNFRHHVVKYTPDLVLVSFFAGNDVRNNSRDLEPDKMRPFFILEGDKLSEDRSFAATDEFRRRTDRLHKMLARMRVLRIVQAAYFAKDQLQLLPQASQVADASAPNEAGLDDAVYREPATPQWRDAWTLTERLLAKFRDEVSAAGAELVVLSLSTGIQVNPDPAVRARFMQARGIKDLFYPDKRVLQTTAALKVRSIALAPRLQQIADREKSYLHGFKNARIGTGHWNEAGHRAAADITAAAMCGHGWDTGADPL